MTRVLVVDDHALFRRGIVAVLRERQDFTVVGEASDGREAIAQAKTLVPQVILLDLMMPGMGGLEALSRLKNELLQTGILIVTISEKESDLFTALKFGARGYILKDIAPEALVDAVACVARGEVVISPSMAAKLLGEFREEAAKGEGLTPR